MTFDVRGRRDLRLRRQQRRRQDDDDAHRARRAAPPTPARSAGTARRSTPQTRRRIGYMPRSAACTEDEGRRAADLPRPAARHVGGEAAAAATDAGPSGSASRPARMTRCRSSASATSSGSSSPPRWCTTRRSWCLDEPFSGLDPVAVDVMSGVLRDKRPTGRPGAVLQPPARPGRAHLRPGRHRPRRHDGRLRHGRRAAGRRPDVLVRRTAGAAGWADGSRRVVRSYERARTRLDSARAPTTRRCCAPRWHRAGARIRPPRPVAYRPVPSHRAEVRRRPSRCASRRPHGAPLTASPSESARVAAEATQPRTERPTVGRGMRAGLGVAQRELDAALEGVHHRDRGIIVILVALSIIVKLLRRPPTSDLTVGVTSPTASLSAPLVASARVGATVTTHTVDVRTSPGGHAVQRRQARRAAGRRRHAGPGGGKHGHRAEPGECTARSGRARRVQPADPRSAAIPATVNTAVAGRAR